MRKIKKIIKNIKLYKNWPTWLCTRIGITKKEKLLLKLRKGVDFYIRPKSTDADVIEEMWVEEIYIPKGFQIKNDDIIVDIGAHIGIFSIYAAKYAPQGKVFSFEPTDDNYALLIENISENKINNITPYKKGISNTDGEREINVWDDETRGRTFYPEIFKIPGDKEGRTYYGSVKPHKMMIVTITLDTIIKENSIEYIDFLKIDCEGAEYDMLFNCLDSTLLKVKKISMECHNIDNERNINTMMSFLENKGFIVTTKKDELVLYAKRENM